MKETRRPHWLVDGYSLLHHSWLHPEFLRTTESKSFENTTLIVSKGERMQSLQTQCSNYPPLKKSLTKCSFSSIHSLIHLFDYVFISSVSSWRHLTGLFSSTLVSCNLFLPEWPFPSTNWVMFNIHYVPPGPNFL